MTTATVITCTCGRRIYQLATRLPYPPFTAQLDPTWRHTDDGSLACQGDDR